MTVLTTPKVDLERFREQGYLVVEGIFDPVADLDPVVAEYSALLDALFETRCQIANCARSQPV